MYLTGKTLARFARSSPLAFGGDLNESSDDRPRQHADSCWPRMGAFRSIDASPDSRRKCLRRGPVIGTLKRLAGSTAVVRAPIA